MIPFAVDIFLSLNLCTSIFSGRAQICDKIRYLQLKSQLEQSMILSGLHINLGNLIVMQFLKYKVG